MKPFNLKMWNVITHTNITLIRNISSQIMISVEKKLSLHPFICEFAIKGDWNTYQIIMIARSKIETKYEELRLSAVLAVFD